MTDDQGPKQFLLRIPRDMWADLEQAKWAQHMDYTEILLQGLAIRLHAVAPTRLFEILDRIGYEGKQKAGRPGRPAAEPDSGTVPETVLEENVQVRSETEGQKLAGEPDGDPWSLDPKPELSTK